MDRVLLLLYQFFWPWLSRTQTQEQTLQKNADVQQNKNECYVWRNIKETFMKMIHLVKEKSQTYWNSTFEKTSLESELKKSSSELVGIG